VNDDAHVVSEGQGVDALPVVWVVEPPGFGYSVVIVLDGLEVMDELVVVGWLEFKIVLPPGFIWFTVTRTATPATRTIIAAAMTRVLFPIAVL
jgi:hypothetical protein